MNQLGSISTVDSFDYDYYFIEGTKQKLLGNTDQAISLFNSALTINMFSAAIYYQLSLIYSSNQNIVKALNYARLAVRYEDTNSVYKLNLVRLYQENGKIDSSMLYYNQIHDETINYN